MPNYQEGKIYSLRSHRTCNIYIGSTCRKLSDRKSEHVSRFKRNTSTTKSCEIVQYDDVYIELVEYFPCRTKEELLKREGQIMRETPNCVNRCIAGRDNSEYRRDNKTTLKQKKVIYYKQNRERLLEYHKNYDNMPGQKEKKRLYDLERRKQNIDIIRARRHEIISCSCGTNVKRMGKSQHVKSQKHIEITEMIARDAELNREFDELEKQIQQFKY